MKIFLYAPQGFEPWSWQNPTTKGIGGSETCVVETSRRLAMRGYDVTCYAPTPDDVTDDYQPGTHREPGYRVRWKHVNQADLTEPGYWIIHRAPGAADLFDPEKNGQRLTFCAQDVVYFEDGAGAYTPERMAKFERVLALCPTHRDYLADRFPFMADRLSLSSNGISSDRLQTVLRPPCASCRGRGMLDGETITTCPICGGDGQQPRDPFKMVWSSSPDRGLEALLMIWKRAVEFEPRLKLICAYGYENWNKSIAAYEERRKAGEVPDRPCAAQKMRDRILKMADECGEAVKWAGRLPQPTLWSEIASSGLFVYPTSFTETSCISCMEAQALGAIPITNDYWAVGDNVRYGAFVLGNPLKDPLCRARYVGHLIRMSRDQELQERIREPMMAWSRQNFSWSRVVDQYERWIDNPSANADWTHLPEIS